MIEYPHLVRLKVRLSHMAYIEQFLNKTRTKIPCLTKLGVMFSHLKIVTKNFKREVIFLHYGISCIYV